MNLKLVKRFDEAKTTARPSTSCGVLDENAEAAVKIAALLRAHQLELGATLAKALKHNESLQHGAAVRLCGQTMIGAYSERETSYELMQRFLEAVQTLDTLLQKEKVHWRTLKVAVRRVRLFKPFAEAVLLDIEKNLEECNTRKAVPARANGKVKTPTKRRAVTAQ